MYEKLVKSLQSCPEAEYGCSGCKYKKYLGCREKLMAEAADVIEELSGLVDHYGGETGIKNLQEYASKYWEIVKVELASRNVGKWIPVKEETGVEAFGFKEKTVVAFRCSVCGKEVDVSEGHFNYCPNCGAKMEAELSKEET